MIKIFAAILIIFSCIALSFKRISAEKNSVASIKSLIACLNEMADDISFFKKPLYEIIEKLKTHDNDVFFKKVFHHLSSDEKTALPTAWEKALGEKMPFSQNVKDCLKDLGENLGNKTAEQETENISYCVHTLENLLSENEEICKKNVKMFRSFGLLSGLSIVILFI